MINYAKLKASWTNLKSFVSHGTVFPVLTMAATATAPLVGPPADLRTLAVSVASGAGLYLHLLAGNRGFQRLSYFAAGLTPVAALVAFGLASDHLATQSANQFAQVKMECAQKNPLARVQRNGNWYRCVAGDVAHNNRKVFFSALIPPALR